MSFIHECFLENFLFKTFLCTENPHVKYKFTISFVNIIIALLHVIAFYCKFVMWLGLCPVIMHPVINCKLYNLLSNMLLSYVFKSYFIEVASTLNVFIPK